MTLLFSNTCKYSTGVSHFFRAHNLKLYQFCKGTTANVFWLNRLVTFWNSLYRISCKRTYNKLVIRVFKRLLNRYSGLVGVGVGVSDVSSKLTLTLILFLK